MEINKHLEELEILGYTLIKNALQPSEVEELKKIRTKLLDVKSFIGKNYGH
jgi:hypothetical protein